MGTLRSTTDHTGMEINGLNLGGPRQVRPDGTPAQEGDADLRYVWEDPLLPNGTLAADGTLAVDEPERIVP